MGKPWRRVKGRRCDLVNRLIVWCLMESVMDQKHELLLDHAQQHGEGARLVMALLHTASMIDRSCASQLSEFDLSEGRLGVLLATARDGQATPAMLAERLGVTRTAITGLVDGLERHGLVRRAAHPSDRRSMTVEVTQTGREVLDRLAPIYGAWLNDLVAGISAASANDALAILATIRRNLNEGH